MTGWIPERVALKSSSKAFEKDKEFRKILDKFHRGHCVVTVATGAMSQAEADRAGLVESHAYAMLDIREALVSIKLKGLSFSVIFRDIKAIYLLHTIA